MEVSIAQTRLVGTSNAHESTFDLSTKLGELCQDPVDLKGQMRTAKMVVLVFGKRVFVSLE